MTVSTKLAITFNFRNQDKLKHVWIEEKFRVFERLNLYLFGFFKLQFYNLEIFTHYTNKNKSHT
jgi:hypothetical protein